MARESNRKSRRGKQQATGRSEEEAEGGSNTGKRRGFRPLPLVNLCIYNAPGSLLGSLVHQLVDPLALLAPLGGVEVHKPPPGGLTLSDSRGISEATGIRGSRYLMEEKGANKRSIPTTEPSVPLYSPVPRRRIEG